jgi:beta-lactamase superfamily II metal-dependent hydrolase
VVVDSCVQHRTKRNPILDYLDRIGVNISSSVPLVVATHADADDIAGVSDMFAVPYPLFVWWILSIAMSAEEFAEIICVG